MRLNVDKAKRRVVWSSAGALDLPELPERLKDRLTVNMEWVEMYLEMYWGRRFRPL